MPGVIVHEEVHRELGKHDGLISALQKDMAEVKGDVKAILESVNQTKGGWYVITIVAAAGGAAGTIASKLLSIISAMPK